MKTTSLRAIVCSLLLAAVACGVDVAHAGETHDYEIKANDGYGLEDCLSNGSECGRVVADAWCEAHGHGHALTFGLRSALDDKATPVAATDEPYLVRCGD